MSTCWCRFRCTRDLLSSTTIGDGFAALPGKAKTSPQAARAVKPQQTRSRLRKAPRSLKRQRIVENHLCRQGVQCPIFVCLCLGVILLFSIVVWQQHILSRILMHISTSENTSYIILVHCNETDEPRITSSAFVYSCDTHDTNRKKNKKICTHIRLLGSTHHTRRQTDGRSRRFHTRGSS